jgi:phage-related baseplate assembly protein
MQDLTRLKAPTVVELLSYEDILLRMKEDLTSRDPSFSALIESDPAIKILEVAAWRELLLRQRINDAARANLLAFAKESDLDHLAALYGVARIDQENDDTFRSRIQAKIVGWSTAGSREHYRYHALSADVRVKDARVESLKPGLVNVSILSKEGDGSTSSNLLVSVTDYLQRDNIKVLTDTVEVVGCNIIPITIEAKIYLYPSTVLDIVEVAKERFIKRLSEAKSLGWNLTKSWIIANLFADGMQRIEVINPTQDIVLQGHECIALSGINLKIAGTDW